MGRAPLLRGLRTTLLGLFTVLGCTYDPHPQDGKLICGPNDQCPDGYECANRGGGGKRCWQKPGGTGGTGMGTGGVGSGGRGGNTTGGVVGRYVGTWTYADGEISTTCDDGSTETILLKGEKFAIQLDGSQVADLQAVICDGLLLDVDADGAHLSENEPTPTCTQTDELGVVRTWTAKELDIATQDGVTGTYSAAFDVTVVDAAHVKTVRCDQTEHADTITKNN